MNAEKEKSAVGVGAPATESDNDTMLSIYHTDEKIKMLDIEYLEHHPDI